LTKKESRQVVRDPSSIAIGLVLPLILILLFGYAMSLDVKHVSVALVVEHASAPRKWSRASGSHPFSKRNKRRRWPRQMN
jgi:hypothetical protein